MGLSRPGRPVGCGAALLPLGDRLLVDAIAFGQAPQALLTMLYRSTDCRRRCGAAVEKLAHSALFHSSEQNAPSNPGTKHLIINQYECSRASCAKNIGIRHYGSRVRRAPARSASRKTDPDYDEPRKRNRGSNTLGNSIEDLSKASLDLSSTLLRSPKTLFLKTSMQLTCITVVIRRRRLIPNSKSSASHSQPPSAKSYQASDSANSTRVAMDLSPPEPKIKLIDL